MMVTTWMMLFNSCFSCIKSEKGQGLAEYALIIVLIAIAVVGALSGVGSSIDGVFGNIETSLGTAS
jgi:pilus assembly protein Flp/PilA